MSENDKLYPLSKSMLSDGTRTHTHIVPEIHSNKYWVCRAGLAVKHDVVNPYYLWNTFGKCKSSVSIVNEVYYRTFPITFALCIT